MKIYLEGVKYTGKSTLTRLLREWFTNSELVDELENVDDEMLSKTFSYLQGSRVNPISKMLIETGIRYQLHKDLLRKRNGMIIVDRSFISSFVYNCDLDYVDNDLCSIYDMGYENSELLDLFSSIHKNYLLSKTIMNSGDVLIFLEEDFGIQYLQKIESRHPEYRDEDINYLKNKELSRYAVYESFLKNSFLTSNTKQVFNSYGVNVMLGDVLYIRLSPSFMRLPRGDDSKQEVILSNILKNYALGKDNLLEYLDTIK